MATRKTVSHVRPCRQLDRVLLGATSYTGRQALRALLRQRPDAHWGIAGGDAPRKDFNTPPVRSRQGQASPIRAGAADAACYLTV